MGTFYGHTRNGPPLFRVPETALEVRNMRNAPGAYNAHGRFRPARRLAIEPRAGRRVLFNGIRFFLSKEYVDDEMTKTETENGRIRFANTSECRLVDDDGSPRR